MKFRKLVASILGFAIAVIVIGVLFAAWQFAHKSPEYSSSRIFNNAQQLNLAIQTYVADSFNSDGHRHYPTSLQDLVKENYLTESDLKHLISDYSPIYRVPEGDRANSKTILTLTSEIHTVTCSADGKINVNKNK